MRLQQQLIGSLLAVAAWLLPGRSASAARILLVFPYDMPSQCIFLTPYVGALLERGHNLTMIHSFKKCQILENLNSIKINERLDTGLDFARDEYFYLSKWVAVNSVRTFFINICLNVLRTAEVQEMMHSNQTFDLMIIEPSFTDALFGLAGHFKANLMGLATCGSDWNMDTLVGHIPFSTLEPFLPHGFSQGGTLLDQINNWIIISEEWLMHQLVFLPSLRAVHEQFFGHLKQSFMEIRQNFSIILLNQHFSVFPARSNVPSLVEVGGMHVPKKTPRLSPELEQFVEEAPHGVVVVSLGEELQSKHLPAEIQAMFVEVFDALPERVIWKFEDEPYPKANSSIYFSQWLPLQALLAHPNVRLLINHGGILSILEAAHYATPVLGLPLFFDQFRNMQSMREKGVAELLDIYAMKTEDFAQNIRQLLDEPEYKRSAVEVSEGIRDQPVHPLDLAVYWTEYVLRHKGAPYMRISPSNIRLMDYYCLDHLLVICGRICLPILFLLYVLYRVIKRV